MIIVKKYKGTKRETTGIQIKGVDVVRGVTIRKATRALRSSLRARALELNKSKVIKPRREESVEVRDHSLTVDGKQGFVFVGPGRLTTRAEALVNRDGTLADWDGVRCTVRARV